MASVVRARAAALALFLWGLCEGGATFVGPFARGSGDRAPRPPSEPPAALSGGLSEEEVLALLAGRSALLVAGTEPELAIGLAEGLVGVGADVLLACARPDSCARRVAALNARAERRGVVAGCEVRRLDLCDPLAVWEFAERVEAEHRPLHVFVNCADDVFPFFSRAPCGWERSLGTNHLGPLLLSTLLSEQMAATMRHDARAHAKARRRRRAEAEVRAERAGDRSDVGDLAADKAIELQARPFPYPLGRILTVGASARKERGMLAVLDPLSRLKYSPFGARTRSLRANTLIAVHLARQFRDMPLEDGSFIEVSAFHPGRGRWLPRPIRRLVGSLRTPSYTAAFLATNPTRGMTGILMEDFSSSEAWRGAGAILGGSGAPTLARIAAVAYNASSALAGCPPMPWENEQIAAALGGRARALRRRAAVRQPARKPPQGDEAWG